MRHGLRRYAARLVTVCGTAGDRLATSRLANIFGNGTMYRHDKKFEKGKNPRNKPNIRNKPSAPEPGEIMRRTLRKSRLATVCGTVYAVSQNQEKRKKDASEKAAQPTKKKYN